MNTLYITYDGLTDPLGQSQVIPYLEGLACQHINITIISFEKKEVFDSFKTTIETKLSSSNIKWIPLTYTKNPPIISTLLDIIKLKKKVSSLNSSKIDLIHCRSYISALIGLWAKKKYNIPFIFDMRGFWADERVDGNIWNLSNPIYKLIYKFFKKKEKFFLQESYHTISLTHKGKEEIELWNLQHLSPISVIPCCTDENLFNIKNIDSKNPELFKDNFVISYLGSIGTWYMLDEMLDFFAILKQNKSNAKFLFISKDNPSIILNAAKKKRINQNDIIIKSANRDEVPYYISLSNYSIFFIKPLYSKKASSPTKMGEIMNLGIPVICNSGVGDVDITMNEVDSNLLLKEFSIEEYKRITSYITLKSDINKIHIAKTARNYFSLKKGINTYFSIYQNLNLNNS